MRSVAILSSLIVGAVFMSGSFYGVTYAQDADPAPPTAPEAAEADSSAAQPAAQDEPPVQLKPVMDTYLLMDFFYKPIQQALNAGLMQAPTERKDWLAVSDNAQAAAELANLVALRTDYEDVQKWRALSLDSQAKAVDLAAAAKKQDFPESRAAYEALIASCNACHQAFEPDVAPVLEP